MNSQAKNIVVLGAGRSSVYLLEYLDSKASEFNWNIKACDKDASVLISKIAHLQRTKAAVLDITDDISLNALIEQSDIVVSLLPPTMHAEIAHKCLKYSKHLATASYVSPQMKSFHEEAAGKGLVFLNEMGLDPGIDHMSAMSMIDHQREKGAELISFESYCGGLVSTDSEGENPWKYKFSWNPRNVVLAGQGGFSVFKKNGRQRMLPYNRLFAESETIHVEGLGTYDAYANRDSLAYESVYNMQHCSNIIRGTLRRKNYCKAWNVLANLGFTESSTLLNNVASFEELTRALTEKRIEQTFAQWLLENNLIDSEIIQHFEWLEGFKDIKTEKTPCTAADILQTTLEKAWELEESDKDEIVMIHRFGFKKDGKEYKVISSFSLLGEDSHKTAMAKTVGLPLAMGVRMILNGEISQKGVVIPVSAEIYNPVLKELSGFGIKFQEHLDF